MYISFTLIEHSKLQVSKRYNATLHPERPEPSLYLYYPLVQHTVQPRWSHIQVWFHKDLSKLFLSLHQCFKVIQILRVLFVVVLFKPSILLGLDRSTEGTDFLNARNVTV